MHGRKFCSSIYGRSPNGLARLPLGLSPSRVDRMSVPPLARVLLIPMLEPVPEPAPPVPSVASVEEALPTDFLSESQSHRVEGDALLDASGTDSDSSGDEDEPLSRSASNTSHLSHA